MKSIVSDISFKNIAVIKGNGKTCSMTFDVYIGKNEDGVFCTSIDRKNTIENVVGIYLSDDFKIITDTYYHAKNYIDNNKKVMIILLDGFGYNEYKLAKEKGYLSFLSKHYLWYSI